MSGRPDPEMFSWKYSPSMFRNSYPDIEIKVLVSYRLDVEAYGWYRGHNLADLGLNQIKTTSFESCFVPSAYTARLSSQRCPTRDLSKDRYLTCTVAY